MAVGVCEAAESIETLVKHAPICTMRVTAIE